MCSVSKLIMPRDGDDGPWSSFTLQVGTPAQDVRTFVSTSSQVSWIVLQDVGCTASDKACANARGGLFNMNTSSTWKPNGFWQLQNERNLGIFANGLFGNDTIGLGIQGSGGPTLQNQILATIGTEDFYVGMFAVNPKRTNYTGVTEQGQASYMTSLKEQNLIPSVSFGYTAGAPYRLKKVLGNLVLGGYDQSRFTPNNMSFSFAPDTDRDVVVGIQTIVARDQDGTTHDLLPTSINAYVDSTIPQIWLPLEACKAFEKAFDLTYDEDNQIYPVSSALHSKLLARNASITFTLGNSNLGGQTIDITLPYDSFDLKAQPPFTSNTTKYFPLQRAVNDTQYTLGRTFLQEAYLIVDWERSNFSLSQCLFDPDMTQEKLISIKSVDATTTDQNRGTSSGKTIGIAVGVSMAVVLLAGGIGAFLYMRGRKGRRHVESTTPKEEDDEAARIRQGFAKAELDTDLNHAKYEMAGSEGSSGPRTPDWVDEKAKHPGLHAELAGDGSTAELNGGGHLAAELSSYKAFSGPYHEMYDPSLVPVELPANMPEELPASSLPSFSRSSRSSPSQAFRSANISPLERSSGPSPSPRLRNGQRSANDRPPGSMQSSISGKVLPQSQSTATLSSAETSKGPSSPDWLGQSSPHEHESSCPISPIGASDDGTDHDGLFSLVRGLAQPRRPPRTASIERRLGAPRGPHTDIPRTNRFILRTHRPRELGDPSVGERMMRFTTCDAGISPAHYAFISLQKKAGIVACRRGSRMSAHAESKPAKPAKGKIDCYWHQCTVIAHRCQLPTRIARIAAGLLLHLRPPHSNAGTEEADVSVPCVGHAAAGQ
ncbi:MAG: hypothetical protein Q9194_003711 [Teloschistes cf. exilis]